jgi:hypothetical protein
LSDALSMQGVQDIKSRVALTWSDVDERLVSHLAGCRIPIRPPYVLLHAPVFEKCSFAISVHDAAM